MAVPAIFAKVAKTAAEMSTTEEGRSKLASIGSACIVIVVGILAVFLFLISGLFALLNNINVAQSWNDMCKYVQSALSGLNSKIDVEIKNTVYSFMPDFSMNLSKSVLQQIYDENEDSFILLYDTKEINDYNAKNKATIKSLQECANQSDLDKLTKDTRMSDYKYTTLVADTAFKNDENQSSFDTYRKKTKELITCLTKTKMSDYRYDYNEFEIDGQKAKSQILTVNKDGETHIVEYICYGEGDIYMPRFMAMYQANMYEQFKASAESNPDELNSEMADVFSQIDENSDAEGVSKTKIDITKLNLFQQLEIGKVFERAVDEGKFGADIKQTANGNTKKVTITVRTPTEEEWYGLFSVNDESIPYVDEVQSIIEQALQEADVKNLYISLDSTMQHALFVYFEGFFNLPVEFEELTPNTNGLLTALNEYQSFHQNGKVTATQKAYDSGITLNLAEGETPVKADILPVAKDVIEDIIIYDIYDADAHPIVKDGLCQTYNCSAIELAYYINTESFKDVYGFDFPTIVASNGSQVITPDENITMLVEYTCLDSLEKWDESYIGESIYDAIVDDDSIVIGYAHTGEHIKEKDEGVAWSHTFGSDVLPHLGIKASFFNDVLVAPEIRDGDVHTYDGLSVRFRGCKVNPLMWFKGYRTHLTEETKKLLETLDVVA